MVKILHSLGELSFSELMAVYGESNLEIGRERWPRELRGRQLLLAEQDFYNYLSQVFFRTQGAVYLVLEERGHYLSALRLEPYRDGLLLEGLETTPDYRNRGFARQLLRAALEAFDGVRIYSHVSKRNVPSRKVHESCGFRKILDHAVYADGSVLHSSVTYCFGEEAGAEKG